MSPIPNSLHQTKVQTSAAEECDKPANTASYHHSTNVVVLPQAWWSNAHLSLIYSLERRRKGKNGGTARIRVAWETQFGHFCCWWGFGWVGEPLFLLSNRIFLLHCCPTYFGSSSNAVWVQSHGAEVVLLQLPPFWCQRQLTACTSSVFISKCVSLS